MNESKDRDWAPRLWEGMDFFAWLRLLAQGRGRVELPYWYIAAIVSGMSFNNTIFRWLQHARYAKQIDAVRLDPPPLFVLGHWRTGTTLMHELLLLDDRHTGPSTFHCFEPCHSILSETLFRKHLTFLLPSKRPMDNMPFGWEKPQEDEFALALLGQPSTYSEIAFPNRLARSASKNASALDLSSLSPRQLHDWKRVQLRFLKTVVYLDQREHGGAQRRLVSKSPPHTARIPVLLEMFPEARFVHLRRDPHVLYLSTIKLWQSMMKKHGLQTLRQPERIQAKVLREFRIMAERYDATKHLIPAGRLVEMRYEDLAGDLVGNTQRVYEELSLDGWCRVKPKVQESAALRKDYEANRYSITDNVCAKVKEHWGDIVAKWGY